MSEVVQQEQEQDPAKVIEEKILHIFETYPIISPSMLQITLGSSLPTTIWKPILEALIQDKKLYRFTKLTTTPGGRQQVAQIISKDPEPEVETSK